MMQTGKILWGLLFLILIFSCSPKNDLEKEIEGIDNVIEGIEARRENEIRIVIDENASLEIMRENLKRVNSDGMRDKINREIRLKESVIEKSKNSRKNQDKILNELRLKKDSLLELLDNKQ